MARDHAQIRLDMWGDDDWRDLSVPAQHLYMLLLTSPTLNFCGVVDWRPARIARLAKGWTTSGVEKAADELQDGLFLIVDVETEEALIRSFVRHDGLMKSPNMATAMSTDHAGIASPTLRGIVVHELIRLREKHPDLAGWRSTKALAVLERNAINPRGNPSGNPSGKGSGNPSVNPEPNPSGNPCPTPTPTPAPNSSSSSNEEEELLPAVAVEPDGFAEFYAAYPRKVSRGRAVKAWKTATKKVPVEKIMQALEEYPFNPEQKFQPHPATWLNDEHWHDEPAAPQLFDANQLPAPGMGWAEHQLDMVLGKDNWQPAPCPAGTNEQQWDYRERAIHRAQRIEAANKAVGRAA